MVWRFQELTENALGKLAFEPVSSMATIQAIQTLALWAAVGGKHPVARDGRLLISAALSIAHNLRLNESTEFIHRVENAVRSLPSAHDLDDVRNKARLVRLMQRL